MTYVALAVIYVTALFRDMSALQCAYMDSLWYGEQQQRQRTEEASVTADMTLIRVNCIKREVGWR